MRVDAIRLGGAGEERTVSARLMPEAADTEFDLWFRFSGVDTEIENIGDALAVALLTPCMHEHETLTIEAPLSPTLVTNLDSAQVMLTDWYDALSMIPIRSPAKAPDRTRPVDLGGIACCFTAGVDSWYSLLKHDKDITHLVLVRGFDIGLGNDALWHDTRERVRDIAARSGKRLVTCETNLREVADKGRAPWGRRFEGDFWGRVLHGSALAAIGLMLGAVFSKLIIPATHRVDQIKPWGSSPLLDPLWTNGTITIVHDGCELGRTDKVMYLSRSDLALETLRVCYQDRHAYNCGTCEKCLRTMIALRLCGRLDEARTFPGLDLKRVRRTLLPAQIRHHYFDLANAARRTRDEELLAAIEVACGRRFSITHSLIRLRHMARGAANRHLSDPGGRRMSGRDDATPRGSIGDVGRHR